MKYKFKNPPINELICGVQFDDIDLSFPVINEFYSKIKTEYPDVEEKQPLPLMENSLRMNQSARNDALVRYWFLKKDGTQLIQLQRNKFYYNWRRLENIETDYPHFENVSKEFGTYFERYKEFAYKNKQELKINYLELTFVDHIMVGDFKNKRKASEIFTFVKDDNILAKAEGFSVIFQVPLEICGGHYNLNAYTATKAGEDGTIIVLNTTVRGMLNDKSSNYKEWFENAHNTIKSEFYLQITEEAKKAWGEIK